MAEVFNLEEDDARDIEFSAGYPISTHLTSELISHTSALLELFALELPLMLPICPTDVHKLRYTVGDASAEGFYIATQYLELYWNLEEGCGTKHLPMRDLTSKKLRTL